MELPPPPLDTISADHDLACMEYLKSEYLIIDCETGYAITAAAASGAKFVLDSPAHALA